MGRRVASSDQPQPSQKGVGNYEQKSTLKQMVRNETPVGVALAGERGRELMDQELNLSSSQGIVCNVKSQVSKNLGMDESRSSTKNTDRMDRMEILVEKLVQVSMQNMQHAPSMLHPETSNMLHGVSKDITSLKNQIESMKEEESKKANELRKEIAELKKQTLNR